MDYTATLRDEDTSSYFYYSSVKKVTLAKGNHH